MCKIFIAVGIKDNNRSKVWEFTKRMSRPMSTHNKDGLGYSAITNEGKLFGERWLTNSEAFMSEEDPTVTNFAGAIKYEKPAGEYNSFGNIEYDKAVAITLHTRFATAPKGMMNTHPFVEEGVSLIHNGVIRNDYDFKLNSTCDSEAILRAYLEENVTADVTNWQKAADRLRGYYACGVLFNSNKGPMIDIFRSGARLNVTHVNELGVWILSTDDGDIKEICKEMGYTIGQMFSINEEKFIRLQATTGKQISITNFTTPSVYVTQNYNSQQHTTPTLDKPKVTASSVVPFNKKQSTPISPEALKYYTSGRPKIERLSDRQIQEEIMELEHIQGRY